MICATCRHWKPTDADGNGECHEQSPSPAVGARGKKQLAVIWPPTRQGDGCGQWVERLKAVVDVTAIRRVE